MPNLASPLGWASLENGFGDAGETLRMRLWVMPRDASRLQIEASFLDERCVALGLASAPPPPTPVGSGPRTFLRVEAPPQDGARTLARALAAASIVVPGGIAAGAVRYQLALQTRAALVSLAFCEPCPAGLIPVIAAAREWVAVVRCDGAIRDATVAWQRRAAGESAAGEPA